MLVFYPYLFDSKDAWDKTIIDNDYRYDMPLNEFMQIYNKYRSNNITTYQYNEPCTCTSYRLPKLEKSEMEHTTSKSDNSNLLTQSEIDEILKLFA